MRSALGFGPCQYILDAEGVGLKDNPTPEQVTHWIGKQLEKSKSKRDNAAMREQLEAMVQQVQRTEARIGQYGAFASNVRGLCAAQEGKGNLAATIAKLLAIVKAMEGAAVQGDSPSRQAEELASQGAAVLDREDAASQFQPITSKLCMIGVDQNYRLARCRMTMRRLTVACASIKQVPAAAKLVADVLQQAEPMMRKKEGDDR